MESARFWAGLRPSWERAAQNLGPGIDQLLGAGGVGDLQKNVDNAKRGLQDLKKDLGSGPEGEAIDAYINLLNQFGAIGALAGQQPHPEPPRCRPAPKAAGKRKKAEDRGEQADEVAREDSPRG